VEHLLGRKMDLLQGAGSGDSALGPVTGLISRAWWNGGREAEGCVNGEQPHAYKGLTPPRAGGGMPRVTPSFLGRAVLI
jgi:hypothetical protein